ncbi:MAG: hypothetical protein RQ867_10565 [Mariprofundaceae bacterium]|nr:hypothetical protein [Mariprofundaceae bacterium]
MQLDEAARRLLDIFDPDGVVIGGICGAIYGVERFTRDVDLAVAMRYEAVISRLKEIGIEAMVATSSEPGDLSWVVHGEIGGVKFQVLPASETGISSASVKLKAGLRVPDVKSFIVSKCIAAGQQDMYDVAALCLMDAALEAFARETAEQHHCLKKLESWLSDRRLRQKYLKK